MIGLLMTTNGAHILINASILLLLLVTVSTIQSLFSANLKISSLLINMNAVKMFTIILHSWMEPILLFNSKVWWSVLLKINAFHKILLSFALKILLGIAKKSMELSFLTNALTTENVRETNQNAQVQEFAQ